MQYRLLYLIGQLGPGGSERQLFYLLQTMDKERYRPAVFVWNDCEMEPYGPKIQDLKIPLYSLPKGLARSVKMRAFRRFVLQHKPEVVHSYSFHTNFAAYWATRGSKTIPIGSIRNDFASERRNTGKVLGRLNAKWPAAQICNSLAAKSTVDRFFGFFKPSHLSVVRNQLDISCFARALSLPRKPKLLAVGTLARRKRWDRMLEIIADVASRNLKFSVCHAGGGPLLSELTVQAKALGLNGTVEFLGHRDDVASLLADSTFLVHSAEEEGSPNVIMEAMACGRAVISTDAGDVPRLVEDGKTGFVVRRGDNKTFVERIVQLLKDPELCRRMGLEGRAKAEREFGLERLVSETLDVYRVRGWRG